MSKIVFYFVLFIELILSTVVCLANDYLDVDYDFVNKEVIIYFEADVNSTFEVVFYKITLYGCNKLKSEYKTTLITHHTEDYEKLNLPEGHYEVDVYKNIGPAKALVGRSNFYVKITTQVPTISWCLSKPFDGRFYVYNKHKVDEYFSLEDVVENIYTYHFDNLEYGKKYFKIVTSVPDYSCYDNIVIIYTSLPQKLNKVYLIKDNP